MKYAQYIYIHTPYIFMQFELVYLITVILLSLLHARIYVHNKR